METSKKGGAGSKALGAVVIILALIIPLGIAAEVAVPNLEAPYLKSTTSTSSVASITPVTVIIPAGVSSPNGGPNHLDFAPENITVVIGVNNTITWKNMDAVDHTSTANSGEWDSGDIPSGQSFTVTLTDPGVFAYHCSFHPAWMKGFVIVLAAGST
jgi:plastocyanin